MAYEKTDWNSGDIITANKMNNIERQLENNTIEIEAARGQGNSINGTLGSRLDDMIILSDTQPTSANNEIWINNSSNGEVAIPTYSEFETLNSTVATKITEPVTEGTAGQVLVTDGNGGRSWATVEIEVDDTLTQAGEAADAKKAGDEIADLKNALFDTKNSMTFTGADKMEQGSFGANGQQASTNVAIRTKLYYNEYVDCLASISCDTGYVIGIRAWKWDARESTYIGFYHEDGTFSNTGTQYTPTIFDLTKYPLYAFRFVLMKSDGSNITPTDAGHLHFTEYYYGIKEELDGLIKESAEGKRHIRYIHGGISEISGNFLRIAPFPTNRALSLPIQINAGETVTISANGYKYFAVLYNGELCDPSNISYIPTDTFGTDKISFVAHRNTNMSVRFARNDDDTADIDLSDLALKADITVTTKGTIDYSRLQGKRLSVIGDSISSYKGFVPEGALAYYPKGDVTHETRMYWQYLANQTGLTIDTINAYAGTTVGTKWQTTERIPFTDESRLSNLGTPDYIIVFGGVNDYGGNPLGDYPEGLYTNMYEFRTAYAYLLSQLKQRYTAARIICVTILDASGYSEEGVYPLKQKEIKQQQAVDTTRHYLYEFNASIVELARRYNCTVCDISDLANYYNSDDTIDGTHPKSIVHDRIAYRLKQVLLNM